MVKKLVKKIRGNKAGFTLVELLVVIAILAILAAILIPMVSGFIGNAKAQAYKADAHTAYTAAVATQAQNNASYTSYSENDSTANNAVMSEGDLAPYLGSHANFKVTAVAINTASGQSNAITGVTIVEDGKQIVFDATKSSSDSTQYTITDAPQTVSQ